MGELHNKKQNRGKFAAKKCRRENHGTSHIRRGKKHKTGVKAITSENRRKASPAADEAVITLSGKEAR